MIAAAPSLTIPSLTIIVPCYNEEDVLTETAKRLDDLLARLVMDRKIHRESHVYFIDDGSKDRTWEMITELRATSDWFAGIRLSRNRGHQNALMAGLLSVPGDIVVSIDADLQDDPNAIEAMLAQAAAGSDIVYGVRRSRHSDKRTKRFSARLYYSILQLLSVEIVFDHADFRLMTRRAVQALSEYDESNLFLRALIPQLGFRTSIVTYDRAVRFAGSSKYSMGKMIGLASEGITSFSTKPLRMVTALGFSISVAAMLLAVWALVSAFIFKATIPGWASTVIPIYLISGVQLLCLGVIGEYIGKIYLETKRRPRAHISEIVRPQSKAPS